MTALSPITPAASRRPFAGLGYILLRNDMLIRRVLARSWPGQQLFSRDPKPSFRKVVQSRPPITLLFAMLCCDTRALNLGGARA
jgi:hypothetical protein